MKTVSPSDLFAHQPEIERLVAQEPVNLHTDDGTDLVILSKTEFERLKRRDQVPLGIGDFPEWLALGILSGPIDPESKALDYLME